MFFLQFFSFFPHVMSAGRLVMRRGGNVVDVLSVARQPATTSGVAIYICVACCPRMSPRTAWLNTGLRTATTPAGVGEMSASGHRLRRGGVEEAAVGWWSGWCEGWMTRGGVISHPGRGGRCA